MGEKSIVGDLINFRGLVYSPINENGVIFLFGKVADDLNMYIEEIKPGFPDCIGRRFVGKGWEKVAIEFEYQSRNFLQHSHDSKKCDLIICWEHNWKECPIEVIELKTEIMNLENYPVQKPVTGKKDDSNNNMEEYFNKISPLEKVKQWYEQIFTEISKLNDEIWMKIGEKYIGWYSPKRAFVSIRVMKTLIRIECFSRGQRLEGSRISNTRFSPRWSVFTVKKEEDIQKAIRILTESYKLNVAAIKAGETTGYFSGGENIRSAKDIIDSEHDEEDEQEDSNESVKNKKSF